VNIKKSIEYALVESGHNNSFVAKKMGMTRQAFSQFKAREYHQMKTIEALAGVFNMPVSEFIKLGEKK